jgi:large subunit ribosomal protein L28
MSTGFKCYNCGKGIMVGHNVSHAKNRIRKVFKPNLHTAHIFVGGRRMKVRLCTKCQRQIKGQNAKVKTESQKIKTSEASSTTPAATEFV